jgi:hypothetical protein
LCPIQVSEWIRELKHLLLIELFLISVMEPSEKVVYFMNIIIIGCYPF